MHNYYTHITYICMLIKSKLVVLQTILVTHACFIANGIYHYNSNVKIVLELCISTNGCSGDVANDANDGWRCSVIATLQTGHTGRHVCSTRCGRCNHTGRQVCSTRGGVVIKTLVDTYAVHEVGVVIKALVDKYAVHEVAL